MTEAEFLASEDPAVMLAWRIDLGRQSQAGCPTYTAPSDRKLRLFACACAHLFGLGGHYGEEGKRICRPAAEAANWAHQPTGGGGPRGLFTRAKAAALLRDIAGNPFRPVVLPLGPPVPCRRCDGDGWIPTPDGLYAARAACKVCGGMGTLELFQPCPWITPQVRTLAQAAYDERPGQKCDQPGYDPGEPHALCARCQGTGRIEDGTLDPVRLAILADCLEESGAAGEILTHLRGPGPHYRGCWALDLILGKS